MPTEGQHRTGRDLYNDLYSSHLQDEARWLELGASSKCDSIEMLLRRVGIVPTTVLEIGCGTGAILSELRKRGIGSEFVGIDFSEAAIQFAKASYPGITFRQGDIVEGIFAGPGTHFDLVVLSHVLEHLEEPQRVLRAIRSLSFRAFIAEVPLEDLPIGRFKSLILDRRNNFAGHVQFFTARNFRSLLEASDFRIEAERRYANILSRQAVRLASRRNSFGPVRSNVYMMTSHYLPRFVPLWSQLYYGHFAVLCT